MAEATMLINYIAANSVFLRRRASGIIKDKRVTVNGEVVRKPWYKVKPGDDIRIDGQQILPSKKVYIMLNKSDGVITTMSYKEGRPDVSMFIKELQKSGCILLDVVCFVFLQTYKYRYKFV